MYKHIFTTLYSFFITLLFGLWGVGIHNVISKIYHLSVITWISRKICDKAIYQISNEYLQARTKKVRKTDSSSKSKGHNFVKKQWIKTKIDLDLYLSIAKQYTKYQMNICKQEQKSAQN